MNKLLLVALSLLLLTNPAFSQELKSKFGEVNQEELTLTAYQKDPEAAALVLFDKGESYFFDTERGYDIRFTRTRRIKIFDKAGIPFSEVAIPFYVDGYGRTERVVSIEAYTYNLENGALRKTALDPNTVFEEKINESWRVKKFVFPSVKEGSVIEYKYVLETPFHFNLPDWTFQDKIPTLYSQYTVKMIPFYEYAFLAQGISRFHYHDTRLGDAERTFGQVSKVYGNNFGSGFEFKDMIHTYVMKDVPAFKDESFITSSKDYLMKIDFQLSKFHSPAGGTNEVVTTWPELNKSLLKNDHFGKYLRKSKRQAEKIIEAEMNLTGKSSAEKAQMVIEYVKSSFRWNGFNSKYTSKKPKELVEQKKGNAAEINLFMAAMLEAAGVSARPVILSTRDHGKIKVDYPFDHFFNYVVVLVEGEQFAFLADGTEKLLAFNRIPPRCINERGLIVAEGEPQWVNLINNVGSLDSKMIDLKINPEKLLADAMVTIQATEFEAFDYKNSYHNDTIALKEGLLSKGFNKLGRIKTLGFNENERPYVISLEGEVPLEEISNKIIVSPFLQFPIKENPFTQESRSYPIDFIYPRTEKLRSTIHVPQGYKAFSIPANFKMDNGLAQLIVNYTQNGGQVIADASYTFRKAVYTAEEYTRIQTCFEMMVKKLNEQIVLQAVE
ncbi:transglutaminase domain-containing protein [Nafulsella turpanensis]|uniref:transglutaminase domain-containing protein n=1 Tax=Nafulsella turpanensis TaxID=1265690 RepID=UPI000377C3EB|nr:DUF3857 domain-containing protein [Nafulsella turpanensis]